MHSQNKFSTLFTGIIEQHTLNNNIYMHTNLGYVYNVVSYSDLILFCTEQEFANFFRILKNVFLENLNN